MKKSLSYLTEQIKKRLAASMFLFAEEKYKLLQKKYIKQLIPSASAFGISLGALIFIFNNELSKGTEGLIFISGALVGIISFLFTATSLSELYETKKIHDSFKNIDFSNEGSIIEQFNRLFDSQNVEALSDLKHYDWEDFDLKLKEEEISYLMQTPLNNEQLKYLKETIFEKREISFPTIKNLEYRSNERAKAVDHAFQEFLHENQHKDSIVAMQNANAKENELEVAYNKFL